MSAVFSPEAAHPRLLFVGDIHLGRRPSRLPGDLEDYGVQPSALTPVAAWRATVRVAIEAGVDAVVLAGDVVEGVEDRFEAYGHLADGVRCLVEAGIPVLGVAGNHDVQALPRLAEQIPAFRLLGRDGHWECVSVGGETGMPVYLLGWSFPSLRVTQDPLAALQPELLSVLPVGSPVLGVLHGDLDGGASQYAPVSSAALARQPVDAWLLGHVHKPSPLAGDRPLGYLGSLVGLDPGEPGAHGPWLVEVEGAGRVRARQLPIAPLRWERVDLDLSELDAPVDQRGEAGGNAAVELTASDGPAINSAPINSPPIYSPVRGDLADRFFALLRGCLREVRERIASQGHASTAVSAVGCRVRLVGRCRDHRALRPFLTPSDGQQGRWPRETWDGAHFFVEKVEDCGAPAIDLGRLARGSDPAALLARRLVALEDGGPEAERLLEAGARRMAAALRANPAYDGWEGGTGSAVEREEVRRALVQSGTVALEELLAQRDGASSEAVA